tara:strand:+ start:289 stop:1011 length:723 start_codon:yes stop_codon:yes gene_type:complete
MQSRLNRVLDVSVWETGCTAYTPCTLGGFRLKATEYKPGVYRLYRIDGFTYFRVSPDPIPIMALESLEENGEWREWMIDDPFNYIAMDRYCQKMSGRVLTAGLGLGIAARALANNPAVTELVVVERSPEVIDLVSPYMPEWVNIVQGDFWEYVEGSKASWLDRMLGKRDWDYILLDIWRSAGLGEHTRLLEEEIRPASEKFRRMFPRTRFVFFGFDESTDIKIQRPYYGTVHEPLIAAAT